MQILAPGLPPAPGSDIIPDSGCFPEPDGYYPVRNHIRHLPGIVLQEQEL